VEFHPLNPFREDFDYERAGLRCGLEIHYQLDTKTKLFCRCPVGLRDDPHDAVIVRHMRPTLSELGEYDGTALMEFKTKKEVHYQLHYDTVCTYEMDDTPPFLLNREALEISLEIALLLNCQAADEIHVSRKQYLDGSIPTGFQRTIAVGVSGFIPFRGKRIGILQLCLEEDACREVSDQGHVIIFRTDRLSTPLVEVITAPDMRTPEEAMEVDRELGRILRATGRVRRGIGTVRQDVNASVEGGTRVEIKGVPRTGMIRRLVHYEAVRQSALLRLKDELRSRGIGSTTFIAVPILCTELFRNTGSKAIAGAIAPSVAPATTPAIASSIDPAAGGGGVSASGGVVGAVKLCGFAGLLGFPVSPGRTFADELKGRVRVIACLDKEPILFHSDGPARGLGATSGSGAPAVPRGEVGPVDDGLSSAEIQALRKAISANYTDAIVVVWGKEEDVNTALSEIAARAREAIQGVPNETRQVLRSGETDFERILPGPNRMYPDTDSAPIPIGPEFLAKVRSSLPPSPVLWRERYGAVLSEELQSQLIDRGLMETFHEVLAETGCDPALLAYTLTATLSRLSRAGLIRDGVGRARLLELFRAHKKGLLSREAIPGALTADQSAIPKGFSADDEIREEARKLLRKAKGSRDFRGARGREKLRDWLIGRVKGRLGPRAEGGKTRSIVDELLGSEKTGGEVAP
jgi:glutamyl-tRNA(Gln) amidotransferase subunit E